MIVMLTQCFPPVRGGIENLMASWALALHEAGQAITVLADAPPRPLSADATPYPCQRFAGAKPLRRWRKLRAFASLAKAGRVTAVLADSWKSIEHLPEPGLPVVVLAHGMEFPEEPSARKAARIARSLMKATAIVANSQFTASRVAAYLPAGDARVSVIPPPLMPQPDPGGEALAQVRQWIAGRAPVLLSLSRLEPRKGIDRAIGALAALREQFPDAVLLVAGEGDDLARLQAQAAASDVGGAVAFLGAVDAKIKAALYASADVFVMPVRREGNSVEGYGMVYAEAAWYGLPAIAGDSGGAAEAVRHGETGLVCDGASQDAVNEAVRCLLADGALRQRLGAAAAARVRADLLWPAILPRVLALFTAP
jgi:phosphatidylinositol alpha-1,6-mannosyltransferase